ncbi:hypothetical protein ES705_34970 [subsurface metagenome]
MVQKLVLVVFSFVILFYLSPAACNANGKNEPFLQEVSTFYTIENGLPSNQVNAIAIDSHGKIYAGTGAGLANFSGNKWQLVSGIKKQPVHFLAITDNTVALYLSDNSGEVLAGGEIIIFEDKKAKGSLQLDNSIRINASSAGLAFAGDFLLITSTDGLYSINYKKVLDQKDSKPELLGLKGSDIQQVAVDSEGIITVAANSGLYTYDKSSKQFKSRYPRAGFYSWAPYDVKGVVYDKKGRLWFASPQGVGCFDGQWQLYTGKEGLPYNEFTLAAAGEEGIIWFGTKKGAIRYDGKHWAYRQGKRWIPDDQIQDIIVSDDGKAWIATSEGIALIEYKPMTFAEKAKWYEDEIDRYHRRTPYEYVLEVSLPAPGDKTNVKKHDSDNDGLWTSMYGAGECFAYGATKDPKAKARAKKVFEALLFLGAVTQSGTHPAPPGFIARTILPTSGHDPNEGRVERDKKERETGDRYWKVIDPRWPVSADGKWYWKTDTSSDELDGHYFFYPLYYDLVAETEEEKERVRKHVKALTDHLIDNGFNLVDHDGKPTRWARFSPEEMNFSPNWFIERGINSLSMLSYLTVAEHITGDTYYGEIKNTLIEKHSYLQNLMKQKFQHGIGTGNQSDDEMAFMAYYNLIKYEKDPERKSVYAISLWDSWKILSPEMNPFFNFVIAAVNSDIEFTDVFGTYSMAPAGDWQEDAMETLYRFPLDRVDWRHINSHRLDIISLPEANAGFDEKSFKGKGYRVNGKVIPVDECYFNHWNRDPWRLDTGGRGHALGDGTVFLLPYYMGLYHGFID